MEPILPLRILAVDPATTTSGWAVMDLISIAPLQFRVVAAGTIDGSKLLVLRSDIKKLFSKQFCVVDALEEKYVELITEYQVSEVVSEGAFAHSHISAALALTLAIHALRRASRSTLGKDIHVIPPTISKMSMTGKGNADKDAMRYSFEAATNLDVSALEGLRTEHEIDAISHGIAWVKRDITQEIVQLSALERKRAKREKNKGK